MLEIETEKMCIRWDAEFATQIPELEFQIARDPYGSTQNHQKVAFASKKHSQHVEWILSLRDLFYLNAEIKRIFVFELANREENIFPTHICTAPIQVITALPSPPPLPLLPLKKRELM